MRPNSPRDGSGRWAPGRAERTKLTCQTCGDVFELLPSRVARGNGTFCSKPCVRHGTTQERFFSKVDTNGPIPEHSPHLGACHVWTGSKAKFGHGNFRLGRKAEKAHRVAFLLANGRWPSPQALHHCDNPACVRIEHLYEGDDAANVADRENRGRGNPPKGEHNGQAKLTEEKVRAIRDSALSQRALARLYGVSRPVVRSVINRRTWRHVP